MALTWTEDFDDDDNSIWEADSYFHDGDGSHFKFRLKQRISNNRIEWIDASDAECGGGEEYGWLTIEDAKADCEKANENIIRENSDVVDEPV